MKILKKVVLISVFIVIATFTAQHVFAFVCGNDIVPVFEDEGGEKKQEIENHVISGASLFLQAQSHANLLLNEYELSGTQPFNVTDALGYTEKAISLLESQPVQVL